MRVAAAITLALWMPAPAQEMSAPAQEMPAHVAEVDAETGLVIADGWLLVAAHCGSCHSLRLVTAQRGDASFWESTIRWMQRTQNLWEIPPAQEARLIAYLAARYNETDWGRRPHLSPSLLPRP